MSIVALESDQEYDGGFEVCPRVQQEETHIAQVHQSCAIITTAQVYTRTDFGSIRWLTQPALERQDLSCTYLAIMSWKALLLMLLLSVVIIVFIFIVFIIIIIIIIIIIVIIITTITQPLHSLQDETNQ